MLGEAEAVVLGGIVPEVVGGAMVGRGLFVLVDQPVCGGGWFVGLRVGVELAIGDVVCLQSSAHESTLSQHSANDP